MTRKFFYILFFLLVTTPISANTENTRSLLDQYYKLKQNAPEQRKKLLHNILKLQPDNRSALLEMGYLLLSEKKINDALTYFYLARKLKPDDYQISLQIAYLLNSLNRDKEAYYEFEHATQSSDPNIKQKSENALITLSSARMKLLPENYFADIYFAPFFMSRFNDFIFPMQARLGFTYGREKQGEMYTSIYWNQDTRSKLGIAPAIYNDNSITYAVGTRYRPFKNIPIYGYIEIGVAQMLLVQQGQNKWQSDLKIGSAGYTSWGTHATYAMQAEYPFSQIGSLYGNITYYSRYNSDIIGQFEVREGIRVFRYHNSSVDLYLDGRVFADSRGFYYNNVAEFGPGIVFVPNNKYNFAFRIQALEGYYLPINTSIATNPNTSKFYTNITAEINLYLHV